jgi:DNA-binding protein YbaB
MRDRGFRVSGDRPPDLDLDTDVDEALHRARRRVAALEDALDALAAVRGRARSADGLVDVVVDGGGRLVSVALADAVARLPAARMAALVVETAHAAAGEAAAQRQAVLGGLAADLGR